MGGPFGLILCYNFKHPNSRVFSGPPELLKTTYILEDILLYCTFFGLILCSNFNNPNSRFCCGPTWVVKNHLYMGGTAELWEVFFCHQTNFIVTGCPKIDIITLYYLYKKKCYICHIS